MSDTLDHGREREREGGLLARATAALVAADALLVTAGAGMGVDSGLPDFRGNEGFWRAYPPYAHLGLSFVELANPRWFAQDPALAWGFYGHRLNLYRATSPHAGFGVLRDWGGRCTRGAFVFTSNVDGQFQRAGFAADRIVECHGTIEVWQCTRPCGSELSPADPRPIAVDPGTFRAGEPWPRCAGCGALARPNVLMFGDFRWVEHRTAAQQARLDAWLGELERTDARLVIVEVGAGTAVPTVRSLGEGLLHRRPERTTLVRINAREAEGPPGTISLAAGAASTLQALATRVSAALAELPPAAP